MTAVMAARARREERREDARDVTSALMLASAVMTAPLSAVRAPARYDKEKVFLYISAF